MADRDRHPCTNIFTHMASLKSLINLIPCMSLDRGMSYEVMVQITAPLCCPLITSEIALCLYGAGAYV